MNACTTKSNTEPISFTLEQHGVLQQLDQGLVFDVTEKFYLPMNTRPWGDYGDILVSGMATRGEFSSPVDRTLPLQIERTGPFVPPITFPDGESIVCSDDCRSKMEEDFGAESLEFLPTVKKLIVMSDWEDWDLDEDEPWEYPEEGEPENYVLYKPNSQNASDEMGPLWELAVSYARLVETDVTKGASYSCIRVHRDKWNGKHLFLANRGDWDSSVWLVATEAGRQFLDQYGGDWLEFEDCQTI